VLSAGLCRVGALRHRRGALRQVRRQPPDICRRLLLRRFDGAYTNAWRSAPRASVASSVTPDTVSAPRLPAPLCLRGFASATCPKACPAWRTARGEGGWDIYVACVKATKEQHAVNVPASEPEVTKREVTRAGGDRAGV